ncbi:CAP domain-containing protein [Candidatus Magnetominusculus xianensis]|uniref:SCP domain-containing protein n=1 Tax=Candidatus Magnetominusculus xianensis TaxID=1748249 RepID=A0ABR5SFP6_9BACT|nr:CAP domain-containing protein [Candidatus Magnetominusculus xianensis]KWT86744.1 hypothetical protein ASN18_1467 [Candidatus Magnetominusculus xianensis]MBF0402537.1 CAP domain-containing protein [Nitrospirota bacterium]
MRRLLVLCAVLICLYLLHYRGKDKAPEDTPNEQPSQVQQQPPPTQQQRPPQLISNLSDSTLDKLRQQQLAQINKSRTSHGLSSVSLDDKASKAAQRHCEAMVAGDFFGHTGLNGARPFHRYNLDEGGDGHVAENICLFKSSQAHTTDDKTMAELAAKGHGMFMAEVPPEDGHRQNILEKWHNYVGLGVSVKGGSYTYCEEFLDKYIDISGPLSKTIPYGQKIEFTGAVISPGEFGLYMIAVTYDAALVPPAKPQPSSYKDAGAQKAAVLPPWDFNKDGRRYDKRSGKFSISMKMEKKGYYYVVFYLKENPSSIPYEGARSNSSAAVSTNDGFVGGAQVIRVI